jgi:membrane protein
MRSSTELVRPSVIVPDGDGNLAQLRESGRAQDIARAGRRFAQDRCEMLAANLACRWFLSLLSAVIALLGLAGLVHLSASSVHRLVDGVTRAFPPGAAGALSQAVSSAGSQAYRSSMVALIAGTVVALWTALGGMAALQAGLRAAHDAPAGHNLVVRWLRAVPLLVCTIVLGGVASALLVFGQPIGTEIEGHVRVAGTAFVAIWTAARWVVAVVLFNILLACCYFAGPGRSSKRWQWVSSGGLAATAIFLLGSAGFSFYIASFGSHGRVYGSLVGIAILVVWLYVVSVAVLIGGELNAQAGLHRVAPADVTAAAVGPVVDAPAADAAASNPAGSTQSADAVAEPSVFEPRVRRTTDLWSATGAATVPHAPPWAVAPPVKPAPAAGISQPDEPTQVGLATPVRGPAPHAAAEQPELRPSRTAAERPSLGPTAAATEQPALSPTAAATEQPALSPTAAATEQPALSPTAAATEQHLQAGQRAETMRATAPAQRQAPGLDGRQAEPATKAALEQDRVQDQRATASAASRPDSGAAPLPRRVPGQSLRDREPRLWERPELASEGRQAAPPADRRA